MNLENLLDLIPLLTIIIIAYWLAVFDD